MPSLSALQRRVIVRPREDAAGDQGVCDGDHLKSRTYFRKRIIAVLNSVMCCELEKLLALALNKQAEDEIKSC